MKAKKLSARIFLAALTVVLAVGMGAAVAMAASSASSQPSISLDRVSTGKLTLKVGASYKLGAQASKGKLVFASSNKRVAKVSAKGVLKARKTGKAKITVRVKGTTASKKITVTVVKASKCKAVKSIKLAKTSGAAIGSVVEANTKSSFKIKTSFTPSNASNKNIVYSSSNTSVATVSASGVVLPVHAGTAKITVTPCGKPAAAKSFTLKVISLYGFTPAMLKNGVKAENYSTLVWRYDLAKGRDSSVLPSEYRTMDMDYVAEPDAEEGMDTSYVASRLGLDTIRMSGSAEFSETQLAALKSDISSRSGGDIVIVDLRQESHLLVDGLPVSRYGYNDWGFLGYTLEDVNASEAALASSVKGAGITAYKDVKSDFSNPTDAVDFACASVCTESQACAKLGLGYFRLPCTDHVAPTAEQIDTFIAFVKGLGRGTWLHFHCEAGAGRTGFFMCLYDKMCNPNVSLKDIVYRQYQLGCSYMLNTIESDYKTERAEVLSKVFEYVEENHANNYKVSYAEWSKTN